MIITIEWWMAEEKKEVAQQDTRAKKRIARDKKWKIVVES